MPSSQQILDSGIDQVRDQERYAQDFSYADPATRQLAAENAYTSQGYNPRDYNQTASFQRFVNTGQTGQVPVPNEVKAPVSRYVQTQGQTNQTNAAPANDYFSQLLVALQPSANAPVPYESELDRRRAQLQGQVDAINARYNTLFQDAQAKGEEKKAQVRGIANAGGGLYSNYRAGQQGEVDRDTSNVLAAIEAQRGAEIAALEGRASEGAYAAAENALNRATSDQQNYVSNLLNALQFQQSERQLAQQQALAEAGLTGYYGGNATLGLRGLLADLQNQQFNQGLARDQFGLQEQELQFRIDEAQKANYQIVQGDNGVILAVNPQNPEDRYVIGNYARPTSGSSSGPSAYGLDRYGAGFTGQFGSDNYLNTGAYSQAYQDAVTRGVANQFLDRYDPNVLLNPYDQTAQRYFTF